MEKITAITKAIEEAEEKKAEETKKDASTGGS